MDYITAVNGKQAAIPVDEVMSGERFRWCENRRKGVRLVPLYRKARYEKYAERAAGCATWLQFYEMENGDKQLRAANFCHLRLCPMCTARRALRAAYKLSQVLDRVEGEHTGVKYLFLTLTMRNVPGDQLGDALTQLTEAWYRLCHHRQFERSIGGWFRAIEITRNGKQYHPHLHAILAVETAYFSPKSGLYITHNEWRNRWQKALRVDYRPMVRIQTAKAKEKDGGTISAGHAAALEAAKYAVKDEDYIDPKLPEAEAVQIVRDYTEALHRRRLTAFGGWLKEAAKALDVGDLDDGDLVHVEDETIRADVADYITTYNWHLGAGNYVLAQRELNPFKVIKTTVLE